MGRSMWYIWLWSNYFASGRYSILWMTSCFIFTFTFFVQMCQLSVIDKIHRAGSWQLQLRWLTLLEPKYYPILSTQYICTKYYFKRGPVWSFSKIQGMNMSWKQSNKTDHFQTQHSYATMSLPFRGRVQTTWTNEGEGSCSDDHTNELITAI